MKMGIVELTLKTALLPFTDVDPCAKKHGGNPESQGAHDSIVDAKQQIWDEILSFALKQRRTGITADEVAAAWNCSANHVAPRITELKATGRLVPADRCWRTRAGCSARVLLHPNFAGHALWKWRDPEER